MQKLHVRVRAYDVLSGIGTSWVYRGVEGFRHFIQGGERRPDDVGYKVHLGLDLVIEVSDEVAYNDEAAYDDFTMISRYDGHPSNASSLSQGEVVAERTRIFDYAPLLYPATATVYEFGGDSIDLLSRFDELNGILRSAMEFFNAQEGFYYNSNPVPFTQPWFNSNTAFRFLLETLAEHVPEILTHFAALGVSQNNAPGFSTQALSHDSIGLVDYVHSPVLAGDRGFRVQALGPSRVFGGPGSDELLGADSNDVFTGGAGDDVLMGSGGSDTLALSAGHDLIHGGTGSDTLEVGRGQLRIAQAGSHSALSRLQGEFPLEVAQLQGTDARLIRSAAGKANVTDVETLRGIEIEVRVDDSHWPFLQGLHVIGAGTQDILNFDRPFSAYAIEAAGSAVKITESASGRSFTYEGFETVRFQSAPSGFEVFELPNSGSAHPISLEPGRYDIFIDDIMDSGVNYYEDVTVTMAGTATWIDPDASGGYILGDGWQNRWIAPKSGLTTDGRAVEPTGGDYHFSLQSDVPVLLHVPTVAAWAQLGITTFDLVGA